MSRGFASFPCEGRLFRPRGIEVGHGTGNPGVSPELPVPVPQQNRTRDAGTGFRRVRVKGLLNIYNYNYNYIINTKKKLEN